MAQLGADLEYGAILHHNGVTYCCGWHADQVLFCASSAANLEREVLDGTNATLVVCTYTVTGGASKPRTALQMQGDGAIDVCVDGGGNMVLYRLRDYQTGFALVS